MALGYTVLINDQRKVDYLDAFAKKHGGISRVDVVKMALAEFMVRHPLDADAMAAKRDEAMRLYHAVGMLEPGMLQRGRIADSFKEANAIIKALVEGGEVPAHDAKGIVTL